MRSLKCFGWKIAESKCSCQRHASSHSAHACTRRARRGMSSPVHRSWPSQMPKYCHVASTRSLRHRGFLMSFVGGAALWATGCGTVGGCCLNHAMIRGCCAGMILPLSSGGMTGAGAGAGAGTGGGAGTGALALALALLLRWVGAGEPSRPLTRFVTPASPCSSFTYACLVLVFSCSFVFFFYVVVLPFLCSFVCLFVFSSLSCACFLFVWWLFPLVLLPVPASPC